MTAPIALVTGGSGGLGRVIAATLARDGYDVAIHWHTDQSGAEAAAESVSAHGRRATTVRADLASDDVDSVAHRLLDEIAGQLGGPVSTIVLNAASQAVTPWAELSAGHWDAMYAATLRSTAALLHATTARMSADGVAIVVGSIEGLRPAPGHAAYAVTKAAVHHLVSAAAYELGARGIRVVGVAPGLIDRPGLAQDWPEGVGRWNAAAALHRPVTPQEVAEVIAWLTSPTASGVTGCTIPVDAGWSAAPGW